MTGLLRSRKVLLAGFALAQTVVFNMIPDFPPSVWQAIDALVISIIVGIALEDAGAKASGSAGPKQKS
jgi:membrane protein CcdC involved in cytochrome C biogenesis